MANINAGNIEAVLSSGVTAAILEDFESRIAALEKANAKTTTRKTTTTTKESE